MRAEKIISLIITIERFNKINFEHAKILAKMKKFLKDIRI